MRDLSRSVVLVLLGLVLGLAGCDDATSVADGRTVAQSPPDALFPNDTGLVMTPRRVRLGPMGHKEQRTVDFTITNTARTAVLIDKIHPSCGCMTVIKGDGEKITLAPGATRKCTVRINFGTAFGHFNKWVAAHVDGQIIPIHVEAQYHPTIQRPRPRQFAFMAFFGKESAEEIVFVQLPRAEPIEIDDLIVKGSKDSYGHLSVRQETIDDDHVKVIVTADATHPEGRVAGHMTATVNGLHVRLSMKGRVFDGLVTVPNRFSFGVVKDLGGALAEVEIWATDDRKFEITGMDVDSKDKFEIDTEPRDAGGYTLRARLVDPVLGDKGRTVRGTITVKTNHPKKPAVAIRVSAILRAKSRYVGGILK